MEDQELELRSSSDDFDFNEKVFLAIFIQIRCLKAGSLPYKSNFKPFYSGYSLIESTVKTFYNEEALIVNEFNDVTSIGSKTVLCKLLTTVASAIIHYSTDSFKAEAASKNAGQSGKTLKQIANDFNFLVNQSCNKNVMVRSLCQNMM